MGFVPNKERDVAAALIEMLATAKVLIVDQILGRASIVSSPSLLSLSSDDPKSLAHLCYEQSGLFEGSEMSTSVYPRTRGELTPIKMVVSAPFVSTRGRQRTSVSMDVSVIPMTGFLGGAICTHFRFGEIATAPQLVSLSPAEVRGAPSIFETRGSELCYLLQVTDSPW
jgi:hypothetical protein